MLWVMDSVWWHQCMLPKHAAALWGRGAAVSGSSVLPQDISFPFLPLQYLKEISGISAEGKWHPMIAKAAPVS